MTPILFSILKFAGLLLGAVSGVIGLLHDFKKDGKLTKAGKWALGGIVLGAVLAAGTEVGEIIKSHRTSVEDEKQRKQLSEQIGDATASAKKVDEKVERSTHPIEGTEVSFKVSLPMDHPHMKAYGERLQKAMAEYKKLPFEQKVKQKGLKVRGVGNGEVLLVEIRPDSPLFPNWNDLKELSAWRVLVRCGVKLEFYRKAIDSKQYKALGGIVQQSPGADLTIWVGDSLLVHAPVVENPPYQLLYWIEENRLEYFGDRLQVADRQLMFAGPRFGFPDLLGGQLYARYDTGLGPNDPDESFVNGATITWLHISAKGGNSLWLEEEQLKQERNDQGVRYSVYPIPRTLEALFARRPPGPSNP